MSDDPFRDDHEAALQRADALARENEELRRENAELKAPKKKAKKPKPAPEPEVSSSTSWGSLPSRARKRWLLRRSPIALAVIALFVVPPCITHQRKKAYDRAVAAREAELARWHFANRERECIRSEQFDEVDDSFAGLDAVVTDPRAPQNQSYRVSELSHLVDRCVERPAVPLPADVGAARQAWQQADAELAAAVERLRTYYGGGDWRDDGYRGAPQLWTDLATARAHRRAALLQARTLEFPLTRELQLVVERRLDPARRWQLDIVLGYEDVVDAYFAAVGAGKSVGEQRAAMTAAAKALVARLQDAPIEIKRQVRGDANLMGLSAPDNDAWEPAQQASQLRSYREPLTDDEVAGQAPAEPEGCGGDD